MGKKITRIMNVSMDEEEFVKFDKGETHSDKGLRNNSGRYSVFPDISPVNESDLPTKEIIKTETVYVEVPQRNSNDNNLPFFAQLSRATIYFLLSDPEIRENLGIWAKKLWKNIIAPRVKDAVDFFKNINSTPRAIQILEEHKNDTEIIDNNVVDNKIVVTEEQAEQLILIAREKARELSSMIFILSNLVIKNDKTDDEYGLEQSCITKLLSDESTSMMKALMDNKQLLDDETVMRFKNWLDGYVVNDGKNIPIPRIEKQ